MMIAVDGGETKYYYHFDGLGSVVALSNNDGDIVERYSYDVFGEPNRVSNVGNPYLFTGRRYDSEAKLYYYRARYYKPSIGRFLQTDPIGYAGGLNLYTYCGNNPINRLDPFGFEANYWSIWGMASCVGSVMGQAGFAWDSQGNVGLLFTFGYGGGTPQPSAGLARGHLQGRNTTAYDLGGGGLSSGLSFLMGGLDTIITDSKKTGWEGTGGVGPIPIEGHFHRTNSAYLQLLNYKRLANQAKNAWDWLKNLGEKDSEPPNDQDNPYTNPGHGLYPTLVGP